MLRKESKIKLNAIIILGKLSVGLFLFWIIFEMVDLYYREPIQKPNQNFESIILLENPIV